MRRVFFTVVDFWRPPESVDNSTRALLLVLAALLILAAISI